MPIVLDPVLNFSKCTVSTTYNDTDVTVVLASGHGALLPQPSTDGAFNMVWWNSTAYPDPADDPKKEIVRVTARSTDTLTVTRAQEGTSASTKNTASSTYKMLLGATKKFVDDISAKVESVLTPTAIKTSAYNAVVNDVVLCDASGGAFAVTLPDAPADKSRITVVLSTVTDGYSIEIKCSGTDTFNRVAGPTSAYMSLSSEYARMQYEASTKIWYITNGANVHSFANNFPGIDAQTPITNADISIDTATRVLTITPPLGYFNIFIDGGGRITKYRKTGNVDFSAFTNTSGMWYFYFDSAGTAVTTQTPWLTTDFPTICSVYRILWNATLYNFTITAGNASEGATYTNNTKTFTVRQTIAGGTTLKTSGTGDPEASGTLTLATGTGDATLTFSAFSVAPRLISQYAEYHLNDIPADTRQWFHLQGTQWVSGMVISSNALTTGTPDADGRNAVISLSTGTNVDDNLEYTITNDPTPTDPWQQDLGELTPASLNATNSALFQIFRQNAAGTITFREATRFPFDFSTATNTPNYINSTGGRTAVPGGDYFVYFVYSTQNPIAGEAIKIVSATTTYSTPTNARAASWTDIQGTYSVLSEAEIRPLYRLIFLYSTGWSTGTKKTRLHEVQDLRKTAITSTAIATGSIPASSVTLVTPVGMAATNVQSGVEELQTNKVKLTPVAVSTANMAEQAVGFTLTGGTTAKTLTVSDTASVTGSNTGDNTVATAIKSPATTGVATFTGPAAGETRVMTIPDANATLLYSGGALGTPSSGTLSGCSGYPAASTSVAGVAPQATAPAAGLYNYIGITNGETAYTNKALFNATSPSTQAFGDAAVVGTAAEAARQDHKHAMMAAPTSVSGNAGTVTVAAETGDTSCSVLFVTDVSGSLSPKTNTNLTFNASTGVLTSASAVLTTADINGGTIDGATIGGSTAGAGTFTTTKADHIGETTGSHTIVADNTITTATGTGIILPAGGGIKLTLPTTDAQCTGHYTDSFQSGYTAAAGDLVFYGTGGKWLEVDADAVATCAGLLGIALEAKNDTEAMKVALPGSMVHFDAWTWTTGDTLYAGETLGAMQNTIPTGADAIIKVVGFAIDADTVFFNPSPDQQSTVA